MTMKSLIAALCAALTCGAPAVAQQLEVPPQIAELINARRILMVQAEAYMLAMEEMVEAAKAAGTNVAFEASEAADYLSTVLLVSPHLYPDGSYYWSAEAEAEDPTAVTLALPEVWTDFESFYALSSETAKFAFDISRTAPRDAAYMQMVEDLRGMCTACHVSYTRTTDGKDPPAPPLPGGN